MSQSKSVEGGAARALAESIAAVVPLLSARDLPALANEVLLAGHRALYAYCGDYSGADAQSLEDAVGRLHAAFGAFDAETRALVERARAADAAVAASPLVDALRAVLPLIPEAMYHQPEVKSARAALARAEGR